MTRTLDLQIKSPDLSKLIILFDLWELPLACDARCARAIHILDVNFGKGDFDGMPP